MPGTAWEAVRAEVVEAGGAGACLPAPPRDPVSGAGDREGVGAASVGTAKGLAGMEIGGPCAAGGGTIFEA